MTAQSISLTKIENVNRKVRLILAAMVNSIEMRVRGANLEAEHRCLVAIVDNCLEDLRRARALLESADAVHDRP